MKPTILNWVDAEEALKWPEGIIVIVYRPVPNSYQVCQWFRPDWVGDYYEHGEATFYAKL